MFDAFLRAFPRDHAVAFPVDADRIEQFASEQLKVAVPPGLARFWREVGGGYFGDRTLYVFGSGAPDEPRDSFEAWNGKEFWQSIYPPPAEGGPVFFAETCFGHQLGFRWEAGKPIYLFFIVDTFEAYAIADSDAALFDQALAERYGLIDRNMHERVSGRLGPLPAGMHYAPIVSPMLGGGGETENFAIETPKVHFWTALHAFATGTPLRID